MSQLKPQNWIYESYQKEIVYLRCHGNELLEQIKKHETKLNRLKQQKIQPSKDDLDKLDLMVKQLLHMLALIYTYQYFQSQNKTLTSHGYAYFHNTTNSYYLNLVKCFNVKLKILNSK